jgi:hypothetical protein
MTDTNIKAGTPEATAYVLQKFKEALKLADDLKVDVHIDGATYKYASPERPTVDDYWDIDSDEWQEQHPDWDYDFSGWQTSSTFC